MYGTSMTQVWHTYGTSMAHVSHLELSDLLGLSGRFGPCDDVADPELLGKKVCGSLVVASYNPNL